MGNKNILLDLYDIENLSFIYKDNYKFLDYLKKNEFKIKGSFMRFNLKLTPKEFFMYN